MISQDEHEAMVAPFYRAIGRAMSRWQHVEAGMFLVAHAIMGTEFKYTSTIFFLINSADLKLRLVDGLCKQYFNEDQFKSNWQPIAKDIKSSIKFRNGVAHFEPNFVTDRSYLEPNEPPVVLAPHHLDLSKRESSKAAGTNRMNEAADGRLDRRDASAKPARRASVQSGPQGNGKRKSKKGRTGVNRRVRSDYCLD
ncbi:MAG TPA: hypothetical protein VFC46_07060 [Humisphaera sp.]|nr:hypothetical protein [Humisphaera sp.]